MIAPSPRTRRAGLSSASVRGPKSTSPVPTTSQLRGPNSPTMSDILQQYFEGKIVCVLSGVFHIGAALLISTPHLGLRGPETRREDREEHTDSRECEYPAASPLQ